MINLFILNDIINDYKNPETPFITDIGRVLDVEQNLYGIDVQHYLEEDKRYNAEGTEVLIDEDDEDQFNKINEVKVILYGNNAENENEELENIVSFDIVEYYEARIRPNALLINVYRLYHGGRRKTKKLWCSFFSLLAR